MQITSGGVFRRHVHHIRLRSSPILHPTVQDLPNDAEPTPVPRPSLPTPLSSETSTPVDVHLRQRHLLHNLHLLQIDIHR